MDVQTNFFLLFFKEMIVEIRPSPLKNKRYVATVLEQGVERKIHFGSKGSQTYIDGLRTLQERNNYWARHMASPMERTLIRNMVISPALLSAYLLWGDSKSLFQNVKILNKLLKEN